MRIDVRTNPELAKHYHAHLNGKQVLYAAAADDTENWVDIYVRAKNDQGGWGCILTAEGWVTARAYGKVTIVRTQGPNEVL